MKMQFFKSRITEESGIFIPIFAGTIFALIIVMGLGLDSAYLYLQKNRLQRAVDAAISNASVLQYQLKASELSNNELQTNLKETVKSHLKASFSEMGVEYKVEDVDNIKFDFVECPIFDLDPSGPKMAWANSWASYKSIAIGKVTLPQLSLALNVDCGGALELEAVLKVKPVILGFVPGVTDHTYVVATTRALTRQVSVALATDFSWSMFKNKVDPKVDCTTDPGDIGCLQRIQAVAETSSSFIDSLMPGDQLSLVPFTLRAEPLVPLRQIIPEESAKKALGTAPTPLTADYCNKITALNPNVWTKNCFKLALNSLVTEINLNDDLDNKFNTNLFAGIRVAGAQLAATPDPAPNQPPLKKVLIIISDGAPWGYDRFDQKLGSLYGWDSEWGYKQSHELYIDKLGLTESLKSIAFTQSSDTIFSAHSTSSPGTAAPSEPLSLRWFRDYYRFQAWTGDAPDGVQPVSTISTDQMQNDLDAIGNVEAMYHCAINATDSLRVYDDVQIFTVGFGQGDSPSGTTDPYEQNKSGLYDNQKLKFVLLHRLANHEPDSSMNYPMFTSPKIQRYADIQYKHRGLFFYAEDHATLAGSMETIGRNMRILLKTKKKGALAFEDFE
jgi:hypothetical protein